MRIAPFVNSSLSVNLGVTTRSDTHANSDGGSEDETVGDAGVYEWNGTEPDLSTEDRQDNFGDSVEVLSAYSDSDGGSNGTAGPGTDRLASASSDNVHFSTSDDVHDTDRRHDSRHFERYRNDDRKQFGQRPRNGGTQWQRPG